MNLPESNNYIRGRYYPHVDGLRACAILPVLLYHAFPSLFPGGFIGVDVFFVISGYLITKGLLTDLEAGKYSIGTFYVRRIRRIFPAYAAVILFSLLVVALTYYGEKLKILAKTALSSTYFATNIYFEKTADYFAPASHIPRQGDITVGDYWGVQHIHPDWPIESGISSILVNSEKARELLRTIAPNLELHEECFEKIYEKQKVVYIRPPKQVPQARERALSLLRNYPINQATRCIIGCEYFMGIPLVRKSILRYAG